ncbi:MAG: hypothetical protein ACRBBP_04735 [Bdellovibrionales bacterium]
MKSFIAIFFMMFTSLSFAEEGAKFRCVWQPSADHAQGFFVEDVGFSLEFKVEGESSTALITEDTFFNRTYTPCYVGEFESCMFAFSYDEEDVWDVDDATGTLTQVWRKNFETEYNDGYPEEEGTVDGISSLEVITDNEEDYTVFKGDDGDGTWFEEKFLCEVIAY